MKTVFVMVFLLAIGRLTFARLGETEQQVEGRYGKPHSIVSQSGAVKVVSYRSGGMIIIVSFEDGVSQAEGFTKPDRAAFSDNEISLLLAANQGGYNWLGYLENVEPGYRAWCSTDRRSRIAYYAVHDHKLYVTSRRFMDDEAARAKAKEAAKLKDF